MISYRPYQQCAVDSVCEALKTNDNVLLVAPTGAGKTVMAKAIIDRTPGDWLFYAHRRELITQAAATLGAGVVMAGHGRTENRVQVASIQTLMARGERPPADFIFIDECHHQAAESYQALRASYPRAKVVGATATPDRSDGRPLSEYTALVVAATVRELQADGYLAQVVTIGPAKRVQRLAGDPAAVLEKYRAGRSAIVFARDIAHARLLAEQTGGVCIDSKMDGDRAAALEAFKRGEIKTLTSPQVLTEGFDAPIAKVCMVARGCSSAGAWIQMVGRVLRPFEGQEALVLDLYGVTHQHGLPDEDRIYSLQGGAGISGLEKLPSLTRCRVCFALYRYKPACPRCGAKSPPLPPPKPSPEELAIIRATMTREEKIKILRGYLGAARVRGYQMGWVAACFKSKTGHAPDPQMIKEARNVR